MKPSSACIVLALLALPSVVLGSSGPTRGKAEPAIVPYLCHDGQTANVIYESGSDYLHARAKVTYDGRTLELEAAPTLYGVRYRDPDAQPALAWSLRGEEAWLTESPDEDGYTREERAIARCSRLRGAAPAEAHASDGDHGTAH